MQRATFDQHWTDADAIEDRKRHPLRSRLHTPAAAGPPPLPRAKLAPAPNSEMAKPAHVRTSGLHRAGSAIAYGLLGFILGAIFWHFVGFWDFVGQVMFRGHVSEGQISQAPPAIKLKERVSGVSPLAVTIEPAACTTLQLDRSSGATRSVACEAETLPLRSLKTARREDLWVTASQRIQAATSRGWSLIKVEAPGGPQEQASAD